MKKALPGVRVDDGKQSAEVTEVTSVSGDCDLGQRKGKCVSGTPEAVLRIGAADVGGIDC